MQNSGYRVLMFLGKLFQAYLSSVLGPPDFFRFCRYFPQNLCIPPKTDMMVIPVTVKYDAPVMLSES